MEFDPLANGAVAFDPAANGAVPFDPHAHATPVTGAGANIMAGLKEGVSGTVGSLENTLSAPVAHAIDANPHMAAILARGVGGAPAPVTPASIQSGVDAATPGTLPQNVVANTPAEHYLRRAAAGASAGLILGGAGAAGIGAAGGVAGQAARGMAPAGYENAADNAANLAVAGGLAMRGGLGRVTPAPATEAEAAAANAPPVGAPDTMGNRFLARRLPTNTDPEAGPSSIRVSQAMDARVRDTGITSNQAASSVSSELTGQLRGTVRQLYDTGNITPAQWDAYKNMENAAEVHTNDLHMGEGSLFRSINNWDVSPEMQQYIQQNLRDLNTVSSPGFQNANASVAQTVGKWIGSHSPIPFGAQIGQWVGGKLAGPGTPSVSLAAMNAAKAMRASGMDPSVISPLPTPGMPDAVAPAGRVPGFLRPDGAPVPTPSAPPPFLRPTVRPPPDMAGQPDPATGLPRSPIPPNTPIPAPTGGAGLPRLAPDTPASVASALASDGPAAASQPAPLTPGSRYLVQGGVASDHAGAIALAQSAEAAGAVPKGTAVNIATSPAPQPPATLAALKAHAQDQQASAVGLPARTLIDRGSPQAAFNAQVYQSKASQAATADPVAANAIHDIAMTPQIADKVALGQKLVADNPALAGRLPDFLFKTGGKGN